MIILGCEMGWGETHHLRKHPPHFDATRKLGVPGIRGGFSSQLFVVSDPSMVKVFIDSNVHQQCRDVEQTFQIET